MNITKESFALMLTGREYGSEITSAEEAQAKAAGLVVVFSYSDDNAEFRGAINDEIGCCFGGTIVVNAKGIVPEPADDERDVLKKFGVLDAVTKSGKKIEALWCKEPGYSWTYKTDIPHATFEVIEDGEKFCRGIVFSIADL